MPSDTTQQILIALTLPLEISDDVCFLMLPVLRFKFIEWLGIAFVSSCLGLLLCTNSIKALDYPHYSPNLACEDAAG